VILGWFTTLLILVISISCTLYLARRSGCIPQTFVALAVQISLSTIFLVIWGLRDDALTYHNAAILLVETWNNGLDPNYTLPEGKRSTVLVAGLFYWLVGPYPIVVLIFSATISAWLPSLLATSTKLFGFARASKLAAWLGALAPPMLFWAPWLTRESTAFVLLGVSTVIFGLIYRQKFNVATLILWLSAGLVMSQARPQLLLVLAIGTVSSLILSRKPPMLRINARERARFAAQVALATTLSILAVGWVLTSSGTSQTIQPGVRDAIMQELSGPQSTLGVTYTNTPPVSESSTSGSQAVSAATPISQNIHRGINSLIGPFPWNWKSTSWIIAGLDGIMMMLVWAAIFFGAVRYPATRRMAFILVAACLPLIAGEAYFHANFGITMRVRAHYLILLLPVLAVIVVNVYPRLNNTTEPLRKFITLRRIRTQLPE